MTPHHLHAAGAAPPEAEDFYAESLRQLKTSGIPFLLGGTYAVTAYTGIRRQTKDVDVFCRAGDYPRILAHFAKLGLKTEVEDERWLAKIWRDDLFIDVIFNSTIAINPVSEAWFDEAHNAHVCGIDVGLIPPTELIWSKAFVQDRNKYDGADVAHLFLRQHEKLNWRRLLGYFEQYWEVLLMHVLNFRFIYPTERECVPRWLLDELLDRVENHANLPVPQIKVCRGRLYSRTDYAIDVAEWGFADVVGEGQRRS
ncbi:MAG: nucleotidyltransferase [Solirubrobacterales bacterium]